MQNNKKILVTAMVSLILLIVIGATYFLLSKNKKDVDYIFELKKNNLATESERAVFQNFKTKIDKISEIENKFDNLFVDKNHMVVFIEMLEAVGSNNGAVLTIDNIKTEEAKKEQNPYGEVEISLSVSGNWTQIMNTLSDLENLPYLIDILATRISSSGQKGGISIWDLHLVFKTLIK